MSDSTRSSATSRTSTFWCGVVRIREDPCCLGEIGERGEGRAGDAPDGGGGADVEQAVLLAVHAHVVAPADRLGGGGTVRQRRSRYSFSRTSRNFSVPQSASRNFSRALLRRRR